MKGQVSAAEAISAVIVLIVAFNIIIQQPSFKSKWGDAMASVNGRDILLAADRNDRLYNYSFSKAEFTNFVIMLDAVKDSIVSMDTQGTPKSGIYVACDCTEEQAAYVSDALSDVKFNGRAVSSIVCRTTLPTIDSCGSGSKYPDILIIWGYRDLDSSLTALSDFANSGRGVVEIADMQESQVTLAQQRIFGLKWFTNEPFPSGSDHLQKPSDAYQTAYQPYKWFYHLPRPLTAVSTASIPTEGGIAACSSPATEGNFKFSGDTRKFWVCGSASVYLDTNVPANNIADTIKLQGERFAIGGTNFSLSYIDSSDKIRVSFKQDYAFDDFLVRDNSYNKLYPIDEDAGKILLHLRYWDAAQLQPVAATIVNGSSSGKAVWIADFGRNGFAGTGDDHKLLLSSLVFSIVNRGTTQAFSNVGRITSYVNTNSADIFEVYRIDLEVGKPF